MATINDNRIYKAMSESDADALFGKYAKTILDITAIAARADADKARIEAEKTRKIEGLQREADVYKRELERYITANPERFQNPRKRKHELGTYGYHTVRAQISIIDDLLVNFALANNRPELIVTTHKIVKDAVREAVTAGEILPGVTSTPAGERINLTVKKEAIEAVERRIAGN